MLLHTDKVPDSYWVERGTQTKPKDCDNSKKQAYP